MACLDNIIEINKSDCIGNSRETINTNFTVLKDKVCSLETKTVIIEEKSIYYVPLYGIIMYYGDITLGGTDFELNGYGKATKKLDAFAICDGSNGTPDMRDRFVVGAGRSYAQKTFGPQVPGQEPSTTNDTLSLQFSSVQLTIDEMPTHNHGITEPKVNGVEVGHSHSYTEPNNGTGHNHGGATNTTGSKHKHKFDYEGGALDPNNDGSGNPQPDGRYQQFLNAETKEDGEHTHGIAYGTTGIAISNSKTGITINDKGGSVKHENRPPYIALGYIMRVK
jgi:microcystin-dependent protein